MGRGGGDLGGEGDTSITHGLLPGVPDSENEVVNFSVAIVGVDHGSIGIELNAFSLYGLIGRLVIVIFETEQLRS